MINLHDSAFPFIEGHDDYGVNTGLSKREYLSAMMLQGILSSRNIIEEELSCQKAFVDISVKMADLLIGQLNK